MADQLHSNSYSHPKWVDTNDAQVGLSEIYFCYDDEGFRNDLGQTRHYMIVPEYMFDEYLDGWRRKLIRYSCPGPQDLYENEVMTDARYYDELMRNRREYHFACHWFDKVSQAIPTARGIVQEFSDIEELKEMIQMYSEEFPFFRLCNASPKDVSDPLVMRSRNGIVTDAVAVLAQSERTGQQINCVDALGEYSQGVDILTGYMQRLNGSCNDCICNGHHHLFMRQLRNYEWEARCFWSRNKLTAISLPEEISEFDSTYEDDIQSILKFFENYGEYIPYTSTTVDIGLAVFPDGTKRVELIEFNSFGPDMNATAGNFSWYEDAQQLVFGENVEIRPA